MERLTRFAPTPSGYLHFGNALNFFLIWAWARSENMSIMLRIDDIDQSRFRQEYLDDIFISLQWLDLKYHYGPRSTDEFLEKYSQNLKMQKYLDHAQQLYKAGFAYYCNCSRKTISERFGSVIHKGTCREKDLHEGVMRLNLGRCLANGMIDEMKFQELSQSIGDIAIVDRDQRALYQLVSVIEDIGFKITHIMRGADLIPSTKIQELLALSLNLSLFSKIKFCFHGLVSSPDGHKLSKSEGSYALKNLYRRNVHPAEFYAWASTVLGVRNQCESAKQLADSLPKGYFARELIHLA